MKAIKNCPRIWKWAEAMFRMCKVDREAALERLTLAVYPDVYSPRERAHDLDTYTVLYGLPAVHHQGELRKGAHRESRGAGPIPLHITITGIGLCTRCRPSDNTHFLALV